MAAIAAIYDGMHDAQVRRAPYLLSLLTDSDHRISLLREGLMSTARIVLLGLGMDIIYQLTVLKTFYPGEAITITFLLVFLPYLFFRGPVTRIARRHLERKPGG